MPSPVYFVPEMTPNQRAFLNTHSNLRNLVYNIVYPAQQYKKGSKMTFPTYINLAFKERGIRNRLSRLNTNGVHRVFNMVPVLVANKPRRELTIEKVKLLLPLPKKSPPRTKNARSRPPTSRR